jgi:hypothetical protein
VAGADRMTIEEVVRKVLLDEHADVIREAVRAVAAELMEAEVSELIGAERGERRPEDRATHRNGYRARRWDTRAGEIELQIPKIRQGSYFPSILEPRRRSERALLAVVQQAYVCGVSGIGSGEADSRPPRPVLGTGLARADRMNANVQRLNANVQLNGRRGSGRGSSTATNVEDRRIPDRRRNRL